jgi:hypothetical protein
MAEARSDDVPARVQELVDALCADAERAPGFGEPISSSELFLKISWKRFTTAIPTHCHARPCAPTYRYSARATELNARFGTPPVAELACTGFVRPFRRGAPAAAPRAVLKAQVTTDQKILVMFDGDASATSVAQGVAKLRM